MPRNGGVAGMLMMRNRANTSHRTVHHSKQHQKSDSASSYLDEAELALPPNASVADHLEIQFRSGISRYMFVVEVDNKHFEEFCRNFAKSPIELTKKIEMVNEVIQLKEYNHIRLCKLIIFLTAACKTLAEFTELILPLYNQEMATINSTPQTYYYRPPQKYLFDDLLKTITHSLFNKLPTDDLYAILKLKIDNRSIIYWIHKADRYSECMLQTLKVIQKSIEHCTQNQLAVATTILTTRIREHAKIEEDRYDGVSILILSSLFWALSRTNNQKAIFDLAKEYPIYRKSDYILKHIAFCIFALGVEIPRREVEEEIQKLFTIVPKSKNMPFVKVDNAARGKALFDLIEAELLPRDYVLSNEDKELAFNHILKKVPAEKRINLLTDINNHTESTLNMFLWPKPGRFGFFSSTPKLPDRWISEINKVIGVEAKEEQAPVQRPGT